MQSTDWYVDLGNGEREPLLFFLLNAYLQSRIETHHESDGDEEVNVYVAGLLHSIVDGSFYADNHGLLAASPLDVAHIADQAGTVPRQSQRLPHQCRPPPCGVWLVWWRWEPYLAVPQGHGSRANRSKA